MDHAPGDHYPRFLEFIRKDARREQQAVNRRLLSVFLWCFLLPVLTALVLLLMVRIGWLPVRARGYLEWIILLFPVSYALYFFSSEVLRDLPAAFSRGALATSLKFAEQEARWREGVCQQLTTEFAGQEPSWPALQASFRSDLESMQYRSRYLTVLAGAVFYLILQGIDSISPEGAETVFIQNQETGLLRIVQGPGDLGQFVGLGLFLVLLHLSSSQTTQSLRRYLYCLEQLIVRQSR